MPSMPDNALPRLGNRAAGWVRQLGRAEAAMQSADPHDPMAQRKAGQFIDSLFAYEHQLAPRERRQAREHVWLRDKRDTGEPLPDETTRAEWEQCRCRACRADRMRVAREARLADLAPDARRQLLRVQAPQLCPALTQVTAADAPSKPKRPRPAA